MDNRKNGPKLVKTSADEDDQKFEEKNDWPTEEQPGWDDNDSQKVEEIPSLQAHSLNDRLQHSEVRSTISDLTVVDDLDAL